MRKSQGVREVIWKINASQREFIEQTLGFYTEAYLFEVKTKKFYNVHNVKGILKELHYKNKQGKRTTVYKLTREQMDLLDKYKIKYRPYKFRIVLN